MTPQPERDLIVALFRRIGEQPDFKEAFEKLPNAERSAMAGDFYNILTGRFLISIRYQCIKSGGNDDYHY